MLKFFASCVSGNSKAVPETTVKEKGSFVLKKRARVLCKPTESTESTESTDGEKKKEASPVPNPPITQPSSSVEISGKEDLEKYLLICSTQSPLAEGHVCKDINKRRSIDRFRKRYFILYSGVLLYYNHKSDFDKDKKNGLKHSTAIVLQDLYLTRPDTQLSTNARFCFFLHTPHELNKREKMLVVVQSRKARHMWVDTLEAQNPQLVTPSHHHHHSSNCHHHHPPQQARVYQQTV